MKCFSFQSEVAVTAAVISLLLLSVSDSHPIPSLEGKNPILGQRNQYSRSRDISSARESLETSSNGQEYSSRENSGRKMSSSYAGDVFHNNHDKSGTIGTNAFSNNLFGKEFGNEDASAGRKESQGSPSGLFPNREPENPAKPFSVSIDGQRYFGGLVTYSHDLHPARICRVMNACIRKDNSLVLPEWMQRHDNALKFQCGFPNIEFILPDNEPPPSLKKLDLVGIKCPRPSMPDFIRDFMPNAVVFDLIYGDHQVSKSCHSRKGKDCSPFPGLEDGLRPAVFLHPRLKTLPTKKNWVGQFVGLMKPPHSGRQPKILYEGSYPDEGNDMTCFRSAIFTRGPFNRNFIMSDHLRQIHFLERHGVSKRAKYVTSSGSPDKVCALNVTISNRKRVDGAHNRLIGRYITNIAALRRALLERAEQIPGLHLNVETMTLEGKSLRWQMNAMQKTDIWLAGHGPLLTNMLFLRENSSLIEIQPFAFYPSTYEKVAARVAHVLYERYIADPDVDAFKTCINLMYDEDHPARKEALKILDRFKQAAKKYFGSDNTHSMVLHALQDEDMLQVKKCAQMQRLAMNARNFATTVVRHARIRCGLPKPMKANQLGYTTQTVNGLGSL